MTTARREPAIEVAPDWGDRWERLHQRAFIAVASVAALAGYLSTPLSRSTQLVLLASGVALLALPHGAIDPWLALDREGRGPLAVLRFVARYLLLAALVVGLWGLAPVAMLVAFLALSAWHFGEAEVDAGAPGPLGPFLETLTRGATPILAPLLLAPAETLGLFGTLTGSALAEPATPAWITVPCLPWIAARLVSWIGRARTHLITRRPAGFADLMEEVAVWAIFASLPVLVAFGLYFCLGHSLRHALRVARRFTVHSAAEGLGCYARRAMPVTIATLALAGGAGWALLDRFDATAIVQVVFIGLAALTLPHVLLGVPNASDDQSCSRLD